MSLESVVHRLIDVAAGGRLDGGEADDLHKAVNGIEPEPAAEPEPEPTAEELAAFRAWQAAAKEAGQGVPADA